MADEHVTPDIENIAGDASIVQDQLRVTDHNIDGRHVSVTYPNQYREPGIYVDFVSYWKMLNTVISAANAPGYQFSLHERLKHGANFDVYEIMNLMPGLIDERKTQGTWRPDLDIYFAPSYPVDMLQDLHGERTVDTPHPKPTPIITWEIIARDAASNNTQPFTGNSPRKPRYYASYYIPEDIDVIWTNFTEIYKEDIEEWRRVNAVETIEPRHFLDPSLYYGKHILVHSLWYDNIIRFDCFGRTKYESQQLGRYFEDFLTTENGVLMNLGANKSVWWGTVNKNKELREEEYLNFPYYSFGWYMRTQRFFIELVPSISSVEVQVDPTPIFWINERPYFGHIRR